MLKLNSELRAQAREALRGKWPMAAVAALIYSAIAGGLSAIPVIGGLCSLFVGLPVAYGFTIVMLGVCRGKDIDFGVLFEGLSLIHISEPTRLGMISYAVFCLKKKKESLKKE